MLLKRRWVVVVFFLVVVASAAAWLYREPRVLIGAHVSPAGGPAALAPLTGRKLAWDPGASLA